MTEVESRELPTTIRNYFHAVAKQYEEYGAPDIEGYLSTDDNQVALEIFLDGAKVFRRLMPFSVKQMNRYRLATVLEKLEPVIKEARSAAVIEIPAPEVA